MHRFKNNTNKTHWVAGAYTTLGTRLFACIIQVSPDRSVLLKGPRSCDVCTHNLLFLALHCLYTANRHGGTFISALQRPLNKTLLQPALKSSPAISAHCLRLYYTTAVRQKPTLRHRFSMVYNCLASSLKIHYGLCFLFQLHFPYTFILFVAEYSQK